MRILFVLLALHSIASADPCATFDGDPSLPACGRWFGKPHHTLDLSAALGVAASAESGGGLLTSSARGDLAYTLGLGHDVDEYEIAVAAGATVSRYDGVIDGFGASTRLSLRAGSVPPPAEEQFEHRMHASTFPLTFEIEHEGDLDALPKLSAPADLARTSYSRQHIGVATRAVRFAGLTDKPHATNRPGHPEPSALDLFPVWGDFDATIQGGTRLELVTGGAMLGASGVERGSVGSAIVLGVEAHALQLLDGTARNYFMVWPLRVEMQSPETGTTYRLGWGVLGTDFPWPQTGRDKNHDLNIVEVGAGERGYGLQYQRHPYLTMTGESAIEDRAFGEAVIGGDFHVVARAFFARTQRATAMEITHVDWTAGVASSASRRVGGVDVGGSVELGRSFYAALDQAAPSAGFGARAALTISCVARHQIGHRR